jgi:hypothetical protein
VLKFIEAIVTSVKSRPCSCGMINFAHPGSRIHNPDGGSLIQPVVRKIPFHGCIRKAMSPLSALM